MTETPINRRVALVTGGSRGIGRAVALGLAAEGHAVAVHYRAEAASAQEVVSQIRTGGGVALAVQADLAQPTATDQLTATVRDQLGDIDILINNAGVMTDASIESMSDELWDETLAVNLTAVFRCTRACIPTMKDQGWGRIINLSSQAAYTGSRNHAHYAATKAALLGFTYSAAKELATDGITVNSVVPGRITTDMVLSRSTGREAEWMQQTPMRRFGEPEEVAAAIVFLTSEAASYITGATLNVSGGLIMG